MKMQNFGRLGNLTGSTELRTLRDQTSARSQALELGRGREGRARYLRQGLAPLESLERRTQ